MTPVACSTFFPCICCVWLWPSSVLVASSPCENMGVLSIDSIFCVRGRPGNPLCWQYLYCARVCVCSVLRVSLLRESCVSYVLTVPLLRESMSILSADSILTAWEYVYPLYWQCSCCVSMCIFCADSILTAWEYMYPLCWLYPLESCHLPRTVCNGWCTVIICLTCMMM
jgi:hypothetical protein